jgi:arsenate reductase
MEKAKVLFVSVRNASRTQMAEGFCRAFYGDEIDVYSAGSNPQEIDPTTIHVMDEVGIDISKQTSNTLLDLRDLDIDYVIMICGNEYNVCPIFVGGKKYFKKPLKDIYPFKGTGTEKIELLREIRDEIGDWVQDFHYYMNGESNILSIADCCELLGGDDDGCCDLEGVDGGSCCDLGEANGDCCSFDSSDSAQK